MTKLLRPLVAVATLACALTLPLSAHAQEQPTPEPEPPGVSSDDDEKARLLFKEGDGHYAAGRYEKAIELFEQAYELSKRPDLLFNLANAYERDRHHNEGPVG